MDSFLSEFKSTTTATCNSIADQLRAQNADDHSIHVVKDLARSTIVDMDTLEREAETKAKEIERKIREEEQRCKEIFEGRMKSFKEDKETQLAYVEWNLKAKGENLLRQVWNFLKQNWVVSSFSFF